MGNIVRFKGKFKRVSGNVMKHPPHTNKYNYRKKNGDINNYCSCFAKWDFFNVRNVIGFLSKI